MSSALPHIIFLLNELKRRDSAFSVIYDQASPELGYEIHSGHIRRSISEAILSKSDKGIKTWTVNDLVSEVDNFLAAAMLSLIAEPLDSYAAMSKIKNDLAQVNRGINPSGNPAQ